MRHAKRILALLLLLLLTLSSVAFFPRQARADVVACNLSVPSNPLSAQGLATPWQTSCSQADPGSAVFVQAAIFDKTARTLSIYPPLVVDAGTTPAVAPVVPNLPTNADVAIFGGGNDDITTLIGPGASSCVNGVEHPFGQVFFCGSNAFFADINAAHIAIPPLGVDSHGTSCPSVRDFRIVDQDQSDNVQTTYLVTTDGRTAQNTAANRAALPGAAVAKNGSDNSLLTKLVDPAIGCQPWLLPDIADNGNLVPSQAADELQAAMYQAGPVALIPAGDPMAGPNSLAMVNAYRVGVDQPQIHALGEANTVPYCAHMANAAPQFVAEYKNEFQASASPAAGENLYDFLVGRYQASRQILGCK